MNIQDKNDEKNYQKVLDYLYGFVDYSLTKSFQFSPEKFNLNRMVRLLDALGNPQNNYRVIHVAGTKGKGSTSALISNALALAGYRTGFYTSPHLQDYCERIQVDGRCISHPKMVRIVEEMRPIVEKIPELTTFEITTALAFLFFAQQKVEYAVIEVGLGGRLDATNVVSPMVSVISSISYDHINILGDTLAKIATEKAGIIKPGIPVVLSPQIREARLTIEGIAADRGAPIYQVGKDYFFAHLSHSLDGQSFYVWSAAEQPLVDGFIESGGKIGSEPHRLNIPLLGYHQLENAATAYATLKVAQSCGLKMDDKALQEGFSKVFWPGRFEVLRRNPPVIVDSAHNRDSALRLRLALDDYIPGIPVILVFGASEDKDIEGMIAEFAPKICRVISTQSQHPRAMEAQKLVELAHHYGCPAQAIIPTEDALRKALDLAGQEAAVVVAGSLFIAAEVRDTWKKMGLPLRSFEII